MKIEEIALYISIFTLGLIIGSTLQEHKHKGEYKYDLPEEIRAATPHDTMTAVLINDTIHIGFNNNISEQTNHFNIP